MDLKYFKKADCSLFRLPAVDYTQISSLLEKTLLDAWKDGHSSASSVVKGVVRDSRVINQVSSQISESLNFQRQINLDQINKKKQEEAKIYQDDQKFRINAIEQTLRPDITNREKALETTSQTLDYQRKAYDASQASLESMKNRLRKSVNQMGGRDMMQTVLDINESLFQDTQPNAAKNTMYSTNTLHTPGYNLPESYQTNRKIEPILSKPKGVKKVLHSIWRVLNYKIW